jgi:multiple sugar transport system ATP-binding protein
MAGIEICGLTRQFRDGTRALVEVDLGVDDGELLVLVGPSGSGKTTLLRLVAGLDQPTAGTIRLGGSDIAGVPPHRRNMALVFQNLALYSHLTVADNLAFGLNHERRAASGKPKAEIAVGDRVGEVAELLGVSHLLNRYPADLSGGEQQRVALGRAIVRRPAALLLDEPLSSLDGPTRRGLRRELKQLQRQLGVPTVYVTHDQAEALAMGDRIAVLDRGRLQQVGTPDEVYRQPANRFVAEFFGPQGMNVIEGQLKTEGEQGTFQGAGFSVELPPELAARLAGKSSEGIACGFRPEDVTFRPAGRSEGANGRGRVEAWEILGDAAYVRCQVKHTARPYIAVLTIRLERNTPPPSLGDEIDITVHHDHLHWFDPNTGNRR